MTDEPADPWTYVVTDVELDGPWPGINSMRSFASVAISADGTEHGRFEAVLEPLPGTAPDARTLAWFADHPEAWRSDHVARARGGRDGAVRRVAA